MHSDPSAVSITALEHEAGGRCLFRALGLAVTAGTVHGLCGPSGVGKSTLLRMIGGLERPREGRVRVFERDVTSLRGSALRRYLRHEVGFVFQDAGLVEQWTVRKNLRSASAARPHTPASPPLSVEAAVERVDLASGLLDRRAVELSGGERQRVALARILVRMPRLVLLDEPTAALDAARTAVVAGLARELADAGTTVILATHDADLLARTDARTSLTGPDADGPSVMSTAAAARTP